MPDALSDLLQRATLSLRYARASRTACRTLCAALVAIGVSALLLDILGPGVTPAQLGQLLLWLALPLAVGLAGWILDRPHRSEVATAIDRKAGLEDRLGTALQFQADQSPIANLQRSDTERTCRNIDPGALFPTAGRSEAWALVLCAIVSLTASGLALTLDLSPGEDTVQQSPATPEDDLLAAIERDRELLLEGGDKDRAQLLTDLEARIRRIRSREQELRRIVQQRRETEQAAEPAEPEDSQEDVSEEPEESPERQDDTITAADLEALEAETMGELVLADAQQAEIVADLFRQTRVARKLTRHFDRIAEHEMELGHDHRAESEPPTVDGFQNEANNAIQSTDAGQNAAPINDRQSEADALSRRELNGESMAEHDRAHDYQESFNDFLRDFVKDVREILQEAGDSRKKSKKKQREGREVSVGGGDGVADKKDAMEESGFEEMGDVKRGTAPGDGSETPGDEASMSTDPALMPEGTDSTSISAATATGGGDTSAGGQGAGRGGADDGGLRAMLDAYVDPAAGPLERVLGQMSQGQLPEERRELLFERLARHKVQSSAGSEADDVLVDYFADAEAVLADNHAELPPLFRDFAHRYFAAIRPEGEGDDDPNTASLREARP